MRRSRDPLVLKCESVFGAYRAYGDNIGGRILYPQYKLLSKLDLLGRFTRQLGSRSGRLAAFEPQLRIVPIRQRPRSVW